MINNNKFSPCLLYWQTIWAKFQPSESIKCGFQWFLLISNFNNYGSSNC